MEAAAAPSAIKPITRVLMFPPLREPEIETSGLRAEGISGVERLCHRKLSWRSDVLGGSRRLGGRGEAGEVAQDGGRTLEALHGVRPIVEEHDLHVGAHARRRSLLADE